MTTGKTLQYLQSISPTLSVGILSADMMNLGADLALLDQTDVNVIHFDVMDGCFVPFLTLGPPLIKGIETGRLKDVHLMIGDPLDKIEDYVDAGADMVTVHIESCEDVLPVLKKLETMNNTNDSTRGIVRGVALTPGTPAQSLKRLIDHIEMIVLLTLDPRHDVWTFDDAVAERAGQIKDMISAAGKDILFTIDGGIKRSTIHHISGLGADIFVSGSAIYDGKAPVENARFMMDAIKSKKAKDRL